MYAYICRFKNYCVISDNFINFYFIIQDVMLCLIYIRDSNGCLSNLMFSENAFFTLMLSCPHPLKHPEEGIQGHTKLIHGDNSITIIYLFQGFPKMRLNPHIYTTVIKSRFILEIPLMYKTLMH